MRHHICSRLETICSYPLSKKLLPTCRTSELFFFPARVRLSLKYTKLYITKQTQRKLKQSWYYFELNFVWSFFFQLELVWQIKNWNANEKLILSYTPLFPPGSFFFPFFPKRTFFGPSCSSLHCALFSDDDDACFEVWIRMLYGKKVWTGGKEGSACAMVICSSTSTGCRKLPISRLFFVLVWKGIENAVVVLLNGISKLNWH